MIQKKYPVTCHTKNVGPNSTFVAIKGFSQDGTKYISKAIELGATKIVSSDKINLNCSKKIQFSQVHNTRKELAKLSAKELNHPESKLKIIGITGTKGKTTTTYLIEHILKSVGYKTALLGSIKNKIEDFKEVAKNTTPESDYIQMFLAQCVEQKIDYVVMEVSSHAIALHRTYGINFCSIGFTNLATEHMDFHRNMSDYFSTKAKIFDQIKKDGTIIINTENDWGKKAVDLLCEKKITKTISIVGFDSKSLCNIKSDYLIGDFNNYNMTMSYLICKNLGISKKSIINAIKNFTGVPGRLQLHVLKNKAKAFVDFAHNPSSMEAVLKTLKTLTDDLIVVFGCGGNRDKTKRPMMGKIAEKFGDKIILTDDNPRFEKSEDIAKDILAAIENKEKVICELDRKKAIAQAAQISKPNSIIAILGKGHEDYYLVNGEKFYLSDFEEIRKF